VITNHEEGKGKPPWLFPKTGYPTDIQNLLYSRRLKRERERERERDPSQLKLSNQLFYVN